MESGLKDDGRQEGRSFVPIGGISNGQSLFSTMLIVVRNCFIDPIYPNPRVFRPISISWGGEGGLA